MANWKPKSAEPCQGSGIRTSAGSITVRRSEAQGASGVLHVNPAGQSGPTFAARGSQCSCRRRPGMPSYDRRGSSTGRNGPDPAQSRVAAILAEGRTLYEIAASAGRTDGTVRWYLKQIVRRKGYAPERVGAAGAVHGRVFRARKPRDP